MKTIARMIFWAALLALVLILAAGCRALHLGGGTSPDDALLRFKRGFGGNTYEYAFATLVADPGRYAALAAVRRERPEPPRPGFFPEYRA